MTEKQASDQELFNTGLDALNKLKGLDSDPKWEQFSDSPCLMFKKQITESRVMSKGEAFVKIPMAELFEQLSKEESLKVVNPQLLEIKVLHKVEINGREARVNYMKYQGMWPVEDRDLVNIGIKEMGDKICWIATQACQFPYPKQNKVTRATCFIGGWILKEVDATTTQCIYISDVDLAGSIPQMIKNQLTQKQACLPANVEKALKK
jgi:hypothetical protein